MAEREALSVALGGDWSILAAGVARQRDGRLLADVVLRNGVPVFADRIALNLPQPRGDFARSATAADRPAADAIERALLDLVPVALAQVQGAGEEEGPARRTQADRLVGYAEAEAGALFVDQFGQPHALVGGVPVALTSSAYPWLRRRMWDEEGRTAAGEALSTAVGTLAAKALANGDRRELHVRCAWHEGALYLQLRPGRVAVVAADGWRIRDDNDAGDDLPVLFRQYQTARPLPDPEPVADPLAALDSFAALVNLGSARDRRLFLAYLPAVLLPHIPRPILLATGPMGAGKTTVHKLIKRTLDPTAPESIRLDRDILTKAAPAQVLLLDNSGPLADWQADSICRLVTGEGDAKRRLYTDDDTVVIELRRALLLNGINPPSDRPDVLDRVLALELARIADTERLPERELWATAAREQGRWLGALCTLLARALALLPTLTFPTLPRLADWGEYAGAVYAAAGWEERGCRGVALFLRDWGGNVAVQQQAAIDGSATGQTILALMERHERYGGSPSELHAALTQEAEGLRLDVRKDETWPKSSRKLWARIKEVLPVLEALGVAVTYDRRAQARTIALHRGPHYRHDRHYRHSGVPAGETHDGNVADRDGNADPRPDYRHGEAAAGLGNDAHDANDGDDAPPSAGAASESEAEGGVACARCGQPGYWRLGEEWHCATCRRILAGLPLHPWQRDPLAGEEGGR